MEGWERFIFRERELHNFHKVEETNMTQEEARRQYGYTATESKAGPANFLRQHTKEFDFTKLGEPQIQEQLTLFRQLAAQRQNVPEDARQIAEHIAGLEAELGSRSVKSEADKSKNELLSLFGGLTQEPTAVSDGSRERDAFDAIYANASESGKRAIEGIYADERRRAINEAGVTGNLRSPGFQTNTLRDIDTRKVKSLTDLIQGLEGERATGLVGLEGNLADRGFRERQLGLQRSQSLASLLQGGGQFGQTFGLEREKFGEEKRRNTLSDILDREALEESRASGKAMAEASKPSWIDQFAKVAGGAGALAGGIGALTKPKKIPGVY